jgi:hypothetical protein
VLPCVVIVFAKVHKDVEDSEFEDSEYRIHYTVTAPLFRKNYFSAVEIKGGTLKGRELCDKARWRGVDDVLEQSLVVGDSQFDTEIVSNGYKIFQFVLPRKIHSKGR